MLICPECGTRNAAGTRFCTNCGTYLEWDEAPAPDRGPERDAPAPVPRPAPLPRPDPVGNDPVPVPRPQPAPGPHEKHEPQGAPRGRGDGTDQKHIPHNPDKVRKLPPDDLLDPAEAPGPDDRTTKLPRVPDQEPGSRGGRRPDGPPPVPPEESRSRPPRPSEQEPETPPAPGEIVCPRCGAGNSPDRHFCRRCALDLSRALAPPPPEPAEQSRRRRKGLSPVVWVLIVLVVLVVLLVVLLNQ